MNKRIVVFAVVGSAILVAAWWLLPRTARHAVSTAVPEQAASRTTDKLVVLGNRLILSSNIATSNDAPSETHLGAHSVRLFKSTNYPPQTTEEKAQWEWWEAMEKSDPDFQWKMPIEFYGKVIDQFGEPVAGAEVELNWTTAIGPIPDPKKSMFTSSDGLFAVTGIQGKGISVSVSKNGYLFTQSSTASFEYAAFYNDNFHVPDRGNPVIFRLQKLMGAEPMYQFEVARDITFGGPPVVLDVASGRVTTSGDFAFSVTLDGRGENEPNYTVQLQAENNAAFALTDERFPFRAPENGYQNALTIHKRADEAKYSRRQTLHFYAKTQDGRYGVVWFEVNVPSVGNNVNFNATVRYNPSGSRNLEFDQNKWINR